MAILVQSVGSRREMREFIRLPLLLYRGNACFVPPLLAERRAFFSPKNPLFAFIEVAYFLARDDRGALLGRVTAHINRRHNEFHGERTGFFGFFECVQRLDVAQALMRTAEEWLRTRGMTLIRGPFNFSTNEECGFLAEGYDSPPAFMMPYNPPWYLDFMLQMGYTRAKDLLAFEYVKQNGIPEFLLRVCPRVRDKTGVNVRPLDMRHFNEEVEACFAVYNTAWEKNWGFVPVTREEFHYAAKGLRQIIDPSLALIAEKDGKPVAFSLALPDYNEVLRKMNGRLFPFGFFHFLLGRRKIRRVRVLLLGVVAEYRNRGIDLLLYHDTFKNGLARGYTSCEMSWILEDNHLMIRALEHIGARRHKVYRVFEKAL